MNQANIVIKKSDGTTDTTYTALVPSAGDTSPAVWRNNTVGTKVNQRPELRLSASAPSTGKRTSKLNFVWPLIETVGGVDTIVDYVTFVLTAKTSENASEAAIKEAVYQGVNLLGHVQVKDSLVSGFSPT